MKESTVLCDIIRLLERLKAQENQIWWVKIRKGPYQRSGLPDLHITWCGRSIWLEVKRPGKKATKLQRHILEEIQKAGGYTGIVSSVEELRKFLDLHP